jgi:Flp pilus assembly protein TadD
MSLIADALKAAQREKSRRAAAGERERRAEVLLAPRRVGGSTAPLPRPLLVAGAALLVALLGAGTVVVGTLRAPGEAGADRTGARRVAATAVEREGGIASPVVAAADAGADAPSAGADGRAEPVESPESARPPGAEALPAGAGAEARWSERGADGRDLWDTRVAEAVEAEPEPVRVVGADRRPVGGAEARGAQPAGGTFSLRLEGARQRGDGTFEEALAAHRRGDYRQARELYLRVLVVDPGDAEAHNNLGMAQRALGEAGSARRSFQRALELEPGFAAAWSNLGVLLSALGETDNARAALQQAIRLDPANAGARVNLAILNHGLGLLAEARGLLEEALRMAPAQPEAHYALARVLEESGDRDGALRHYRLFLATGAGRFPELDAMVRQHLMALEESG